MGTVNQTQPFGAAVIYSCQLPQQARKQMAYRYWTRSVEKDSQSVGRTCTEALADALRNGDKSIQPTLLSRLANDFRQYQQRFLVSGAGKIRSLEGVLRFLESRGLAPDTQTVSRARNILRKTQYPKA